MFSSKTVNDLTGRLFTLIDDWLTYEDLPLFKDINDKDINCK